MQEGREVQGKSGTGIILLNIYYLCERGKKCFIAFI